MKNIGLLIAVIGLSGLGFTFFSKNFIVGFKELGVAICICLCFVGFFLFLKEKFKEVLSRDTQRTNKNVSHLLKEGHKIKITLDNADVKTRTYQKADPPSSFPSNIEILDSLVGKYKTNITSDVIQTYIVYSTVINGSPYRFISYPTFKDPISVKKALDEQGAYLYINKNDLNDYYFDLPYI